MATATNLKPTSATVLRDLTMLPVGQLEAMLPKVHLLCASRRGRALSLREAELLIGIYRTLPDETRAAYQRLKEKSRTESLTAAEHRRLLRLSDEVEGLNVERVRSLAELAALRRTPLRKLMASLGIDSMSDV